MPPSVPATPPLPAAGQDVTRLRDLSPMQWKGGIAAWLGWFFDGLDSYLYILVAVPFVTILLQTKAEDPAIDRYGSYIQAAFLVGWALGGAVFGRLGDRFGRSRTMSWTILTYALCTGLSGLAQNWQELMLFRFLAALGIGGEWAAGSSLVSETWPRKWRPWVSSALQSAYQCGILLASATSFLLAPYSPRWVFLIGILPALVVFWMRRAIPETEEWHKAKAENAGVAKPPTVADLFRGEIRRTTILTILVCSVALITVWGFLFWSPQQLRKLPDIAALDKKSQGHYVAICTAIGMIVGICGNFFAGMLARFIGYRKAMALMFLGGLVSLFLTYHFPHDSRAMLLWVPLCHFFVQGVFGLFPLYVPPLFPTLLRTTGAGFSYNVGRLAAAVGTVVFGIVATNINRSTALEAIGYVYIPGLLIACFIPEPNAKTE